MGRIGDAVAAIPAVCTSDAFGVETSGGLFIPVIVLLALQDGNPEVRRRAAELLAARGD